MNGFATIDYDEPNGSSYRGIELHIGKKIVRFDTGDPVVDFLDYLIGVVDHGLEYVSCSSSFDHWFMDDARHDGKEVVRLHFDPVTHEPIKKFDMAMLMSQNWIVIWAYKDMKTMKDVTAYVKEKKSHKKGPAKMNAPKKSARKSK